MVWDRDDYLSEAEKQLCDRAIFKYVSFNERILKDIVASSNKVSSKEKSNIRKKSKIFFVVL